MKAPAPSFVPVLNIHSEHAGEGIAWDVVEHALRPM